MPYIDFVITTCTGESNANTMTTKYLLNIKFNTNSIQIPTQLYSL